MQWEAFEPDPSGHHVAYVQQLVEVARKQGAGIHAVFSPPTSSDDHERIERLQDVGAEVARTPLGRVRLFGHVLRALRRQTTSRVVILDVDRWVAPVVFAQLVSRRRGKLRVLFMRPVAQEQGLKSGLRFRIKLMAARVLLASAGQGSVAILAPGSTRWHEAWPRGTVAVEDVNLLPPTADREEARRWFGLPADALVISQLGVLSERKNPRILAEAVVILADEVPQAVYLLCVGPDQDGSSATFQGMDPRVTVIAHPRFVDDETMSMAVAASDVVACLYSNEGSSGIVMAAQAHAVPVVAAGALGVTAMVRELGAGEVCDLTPVAVGAAIQRACRRPRRLVGVKGRRMTVTDWLSR